MRKIYLVGSIDEEAFLNFCEKLDELEASPKPVEMILNSPGGSALDALAFYSRIKNSKCPINITVYGCCYSAAVLVLAAGHARRMTRESWVMVHEDSTTLKNRDTTNIEKEADQMRRNENQWNALLEKNSNITFQKWEYMHKSTTYLNARECLEIGLIEEIV